MNDLGLTSADVERIAEGFDVSPRDVIAASIAKSRAMRGADSSEEELRKKEAQALRVMDLVERGCSAKEIASDLKARGEDVDKKELSILIGELEKERLLLNKYRDVQSLQLTKLQAQILSRVTPEKIEAAPLADLARAFKIFKDAERVTDGKPTEIHGLLGLLVQMEKEEGSGGQKGAEIIDVTPGEDLLSTLVERESKLAEATDEIEFDL